MSEGRVSIRAKTKAMYRRALFWPTMCTVALFGIADANPLFLILALSGAMLAWFVSVRSDQPLPRFLINVCLILVLSIAALVMLQVGVGVSTFAIFAAMLLVVKLFDLHAPRDDGQVLLLLVSLVIASVLTSNSLITGFLLLITAILLLRAVTRFHMYAAAHQAGENSLLVGITQRGLVDLRSTQIATVFLSVLIGTFVFLILPRNMGTSVFGEWGTANTGSVTGFTDQVELGRPGLISQSPKPVLDLQVLDRNGDNIGSAATPAIYLRGAVLTKYNNGRWVRPDTTAEGLLEVQHLAANEARAPSRVPSPRGWDKQFRISLHGGIVRQSVLFLPWMPVEFRSPSAPIHVGIDKSNGRMIHAGNGSSVNYQVRTIDADMLDVVIPEGNQRAPVDEQGITPAITELASKIIQDAGLDPDPETRSMSDDKAVLRVLEKHLQAKYAYSLNIEPVPPERDATEWFLLERREGHCEYYASALVLMARSAGIPARVITGYVASDFNEVTGEYIIRESNAHAWVEAEIAPMKWLTFDGTPRADFQQIHEPRPGLLHSMTRWYQTIEYAWVKTVIGYDSQSRQKVFGNIAPDLGLIQFANSMRNRLRRGKSALIKQAALVAIAVFGLSFVLGLVLIRFRTVLAALLAPIHRFWANIVARTTGHTLTEQEQHTNRLSEAIARGLATAGIEREHWMPLRSTLNAQHPDEQSMALHNALDHAASLLYRFRFAPADSVPESGEVADAIVQLHASENLAGQPDRRVDR